MQDHRYRINISNINLWNNEWWGINLFAFPFHFPFLMFGVTLLRHVDRQGLSKLWEKECHVSSLNGRISGLSDLHKLLSISGNVHLFLSCQPFSVTMSVTISRALKHMFTQPKLNDNGGLSSPSWNSLKKHWVKIKYFQIYIF